MRRSAPELTMIGYGAQPLAEKELGGLTGAGRGKKNSDGLIQRNACCDRDCETRAGTFELRIPNPIALQISPFGRLSTPI